MSSAPSQPRFSQKQLKSFFKILERELSKALQTERGRRVLLSWYKAFQFIEQVDIFDQLLVREFRHGIYDGLESNDGRIKGGRKTADYYNVSREIAVKEASNKWRDEPHLTKTDMIEYLKSKLVGRCASDRIMWEWLSKAHKEGRMKIPPAAIKRGRPHKNPS